MFDVPSIIYNRKQVLGSGWEEAMVNSKLSIALPTAAAASYTFPLPNDPFHPTVAYNDFQRLVEAIPGGIYLHRPQAA
jgi:hypothetical protein